VISPLLSNILLTPFDKEMRRKGYRMTRWADDWVITCESQSEAQAALACARKILEKLGVALNEKKTRIVHVKNGFEFLRFRIGKGKGNLKLNKARIKARLNKLNLYAIPADKSVNRFKDAIRQLTGRRRPRSAQEIVKDLNPVIRGWGNYFKKAFVKRRFNQLDTWIIPRI